jgi:hypothetical protein
MQQMRRLFSAFPWTLAELVVAILLGILLGAASLWTSPLGVAALVVGGIAALIVVRRHGLLILGYMLFTSTILDASYTPAFHLGFGTVYLTDIIIIVSFAIVGLRALSEAGFEIIHTPLDLPVLLFWVTMMFSTLLAMYNGSTTLSNSLGDMRVVTSYLLFFIVTNLVRNEHELRFLWRSLITFAVITALGMIAQYVVGGSVKILPGRVEDLSTEGVNYTGITRIIPPGEAIIFVALMVTIILIAMNPRRALSFWMLLILALLGLGILLTYKRHLAAALALAVVLLFFLLTSARRARIVWIGLSVLLVLVLAIGLVSLFPESRAMGFVAASSARFSSLFEGSTYSSPTSSFQWRAFEYTYAIPQVFSHPILGLGLGTQYRPWVWGRDWAPDGDLRAYTHNGHLAILLRSGALGYFFFFLFSLVFLWRGFRYWREVPDEEARAIVLGTTLSYIGLLVGSIISPIVMTTNWTPMLGVIFGLNEVIYRVYKVQKLRQNRLGAMLHG